MQKKFKTTHFYSDYCTIIGFIRLPTGALANSLGGMGGRNLGGKGTEMCGAVLGGTLDVLVVAVLDTDAEVTVAGAAVVGALLLEDELVVVLVAAVVALFAMLLVESLLMCTCIEKINGLFVQFFLDVFP